MSSAIKNGAQKRDSVEVFTEFVELIFAHIKSQRSIDFSFYKDGTLTRRLASRLAKTGHQDYESYYKYLLETPAETQALIEALTIKVSHFFRNSYVFEAFNEFILPEFLDRSGTDVLRVWSAGCAWGEEPYSFAMLFRDCFGEECFDHLPYIIGTDIDPSAIECAIKGEYTEEYVQNVKKGLLDRYFKFAGGVYKLGNEIKSIVDFAVHDLTTFTTPKQAVFGNFDLIICRNVMIYFERTTCERIFDLFDKSIAVGGYVMLGEAETIPHAFEKRYLEAIPRTKLFRKKA